jgi:hypothetical protein
LNILELYFILNESILENSNFFNETKNLIIKEYENILNLIGYNTIMTLYIPSNNIKINELLFSDFELAYVDKETFRDSYQIYYKVMLNSFFEDTKGITKSNIITKILEHYGLNIIFNPRVESRLKLTRKSLHLDDIKIITKDIMEVKELQNLPEYDYDLNKMMFLIKLLMDYVNYNYKYLDNNLNNFAMKLYFPSNIIIFNNKLFDIFTGILKNTISLSLQCISKQNIFVNNYISLITKYSLNFGRYFIDNLKIITDYKPNRLILTSSINEVQFFTNYKCDIINIKNQKDNNEELKKLKTINKNILGAFNINQINTIFNMILRNIETKDKATYLDAFS